MEHLPGVKLIYSDTDSWKCAADGDERLIPFDVVPRIISASEWRRL